MCIYVCVRECLYSEFKNLHSTRAEFRDGILQRIIRRGSSRSRVPRHVESLSLSLSRARAPHVRRRGTCLFLYNFLYLCFHLITSSARRVQLVGFVAYHSRLFLRKSAHVARERRRSQWRTRSRGSNFLERPYTFSPTTSLQRLLHSLYDERATASSSKQHVRIFSLFYSLALSHSPSLSLSPSRSLSRSFQKFNERGRNGRNPWMLRNCRAARVMSS